MTTTELVKVVGEWGKYNFDVHDPWLGMVEEVGEIAHCLLKRKQKIRGFEDEAYFQSHLIDGIADFGVYAAHYAYIHEMDMEYKTIADDLSVKKEDNFLIGEVMWKLCILLPIRTPHTVLFHNILKNMERLASNHDIAFPECVFNIWEKIVAKRDWRKAPADGIATT